MAEISRFFGIIIAMYYNEHGPPHFHARYGEHQASIVIEDGTILAGSMPGRARRLVEEWRELNKEELALDWERARDRRPLVRIEPLE